MNDELMENARSGANEKLVVKRDGKICPYELSRIRSAVYKAYVEVYHSEEQFKEKIGEIITEVNRRVLEKEEQKINIEEIQDIVIEEVNKVDKVVGKAFKDYREERSRIRESKQKLYKEVEGILDGTNLKALNENANKKGYMSSTQRDLMAGETSKFIARKSIPKEILDLHDKGIIHIHDMDYYAQHMHNCDLVNLEDMLQNGTVISGTMIVKPRSFSTACNIATQIIAQVASSQYGGQSISLTHLAPFVQVSREKITEEVREELKIVNVKMDEAQISSIVEERLKREIRKGIQTIQYQVVTLMTTNGQAPFVTVFMYLNEARSEQEKKDLAMIIEETLRERIQGVKNEKGVWISPAFPKLIYVLEDDNVAKDSPYYYLTELAAECSAKRLVPDYISEKKMKEYKVDKNGEGHCYTCMGCRSFLTPYVDPETNEPRYYGRFNQGVVTVNLIDIALSSAGEVKNKDMKSFWKIFDERMELCHRALQCRHERLTGTKSDAAPILWQFGALARLKKGETIDKLLHGGYSTLSLGYAGLWETVIALNGHKLTEPEGEALGLKIMEKLNEYTAKWKAAENIDYSLYGTPLESTTYKFAKCLQKRFGVIEHITDKQYITNSYHVHVTEPIDAFSKLALEAKFQKLSPGGAISYVEVPNMQNNIQAVLDVMSFIYDNIMYAELNTKSDYCQVCGYDGEIKIVEDEDGKLVWECPNCHNRDQSKLNVARRTCGYIGTNFWNQGRTQEIKERVLHL